MQTTFLECPKCGIYVTFEYFDTAGSHWRCPKCGLTDRDYKITYSTDYKLSFLDIKGENMAEAKIKVKNLPDAPEPTVGKRVRVTPDDDYWLRYHEKKRMLVEPKNMRPLNERER